MPKYVKFKKTESRYRPNEIFEVVEEVLDDDGHKYGIHYNGTVYYFWQSRFDEVMLTWPPKETKRKYSNTFQKDVVYK